MVIPLDNQSIKVFRSFSDGTTRYVNHSYNSIKELIIGKNSGNCNDYGFWYDCQDDER